MVAQKTDPIKLWIYIMGSFYTALFYHSRWYKILIAQRLRLCATWAQCMSGVASILFAEIWKKKKKISGVKILLTSLSVCPSPRDFFGKNWLGLRLLVVFLKKIHAHRGLWSFVEIRKKLGFELGIFNKWILFFD